MKEHTPDKKVPPSRHRGGQPGNRNRQKGVPGIQLSVYLDADSHTEIARQLAAQGKAADLRSIRAFARRIIAQALAGFVHAGNGNVTEDE